MDKAVFWIVRWQSAEHLKDPDGHPAVMRMTQEKHDNPQAAGAACYGMWAPEMRAKPLTHLVGQMRKAKWLHEQQMSNQGYVNMKNEPVTDVPVITEKNSRWN